MRVGGKYSIFKSIFFQVVKPSKYHKSMSFKCIRLSVTFPITPHMIEITGVCSQYSASRMSTISRVTVYVEEMAERRQSSTGPV